jgi:hypothetical protein
VHQGRDYMSMTLSGAIRLEVGTAGALSAGESCPRASHAPAATRFGLPSRRELGA